MDRFEYLSVLVSIVIALGISEVLTAWGRLLRRRHEVRLCWIHASWSLFMIVLMAQLWWGFWNYRVVEEWTFFNLMLVLTLALLIVLAALVITPSDRVEPGLDLRRFFFENRKLFFGTGAVLFCQIALSDAVVSHQPVLHVENAFRGAGVVLALLAARSESVRVHGAIVVAGFVLLAGFTALEFRV